MNAYRTPESIHTLQKMLGCLLYTHIGSNVEKLRWSWVKKYHINIIKFQRVQFWLNVGAKQPSNCILKCRIWDRIEFFCDSEWRFCDLLRRNWDINACNICSFVSGKLFVPIMLCCRFVLARVLLSRLTSTAEPFCV